MYTVGKIARGNGAAFGVLCLTALAGCLGQPGHDAPPPTEVVQTPVGSGQDSCGAAALQNLVGQDRAVISGMRFSQVLRVYEAGQPVTMDFNPERLNIQYSKGGRIQAVTCG